MNYLIIFISIVNLTKTNVYYYKYLTIR